MQYIRETYGVPAQRGGRVEYTHSGRLGTITGSRNAHLRIKLDGDRRSGIYHPTWQMRYLGASHDQ